MASMACRRSAFKESGGPVEAAAAVDLRDTKDRRVRFLLEERCGERVSPWTGAGASGTDAGRFAWGEGSTTETSDEG